MELKKAGHRRIVLDCSSESLHHILSQAQQVGMMTGKSGSLSKS